MQSSKIKSSSQLFDDDAIAIDKAFNRDAEEGVIPDFLVVGAVGRRAERAAAGHGSDCRDGGEKNEHLFHGFFLFWLEC